MRRRAFLFAMPLSVALGAAFGPVACGNDATSSPFGSSGGIGGAQGGEGAQAGFSLDVDSGIGGGFGLGGPCSDDGQCRDELDCTRDRCDLELGRCRFDPEDARCDDEVFCNGVERCDFRNGCRAGEPVACSDDNTCTIDRCDESTHDCVQEPRDQDGDGQAPWNCGGQDCDDADARVNGDASEVCGNSRDDDCDGDTDEAECERPANDECADALEISASGFYDLDLTASALDYPTSCATEDDRFRDVVAAIIVPEGPARDVNVVARVDTGEISLGTAARCGDLLTARCERSYEATSGGEVSRLVLRALEPGAYPVYVAGTKETSVTLSVEYGDAATEPDPDGETCGTARPLEEGTTQVVTLAGLTEDGESQCGDEDDTGDAFFSFELTEPRDVTLTAEALDDYGEPVLSLLDDGCEEERTCRRGQPGRLFARALPAGSYRVLVRGSAPSDVEIGYRTAPPSEPLPGEGCDAPLPATPGEELLVELNQHEDAVDPGCLVGAADATLALDLTARSDVLLVGRFADDDRGALSITDSSCAEPLQPSACTASSSSPIRARASGVPAGNYRAVVESALGGSVAATAFVRAAKRDVLVPFADDCATAFTIPETGGAFTGSTASAFADYGAGCDIGGQSPAGAPDQLLALELTAPRRVVFDMSGSDYATLLSVRRLTAAVECPGEELPRACAAGYSASRSFLDLRLDAGKYYVQIDGYDGESGSWRLEVFTADP